ncbi:hypothetical protein FQA47_013790 [Oryzias melastigma]|uniref:Uncharacterized protein n=1 Tax=Oryzias melastigma TaxID=30732 RepID=A0A834BXL6_ORYME|nr:hypothetical protein FQA47_013790 [Oryzias melastigma]
MCANPPPDVCCLSLVVGLLSLVTCIWTALYNRSKNVQTFLQVGFSPRTPRNLSPILSLSEDGDQHCMKKTAISNDPHRKLTANMSLIKNNLNCFTAEVSN